MSDYSVNDIIKTYDAYADERDHAGLKPENARNVDEAMALFRKRGVKSILEIGSGPGNAAEVFHAAKFDIECTDLSPRMIELVTDKGIPGRVLDCREIASIGRVYDAAFSINALLHIPNAELPSVLQSISDVLVEKGLFVLGLWGGPYMIDVHGLETISSSNVLLLMAVALIAGPSERMRANAETNERAVRQAAAECTRATGGIAVAPRHDKHPLK